MIAQNEQVVKRKARAAAVYAERYGWCVFPLVQGRKIPHEGTRGHLDATNDPAKVRAMWDKWPGSNVGLNCERSQILAVDLDVKDGVEGILNWQRLVQGHSIDDATTINLTPSGGEHYLYRVPSGTELDPPGKLAEGVDVKWRGYVILPPSELDGTGEGDVAAPYAWDVAHHPESVKPLPVPVSLLELLQRRASGTSTGDRQGDQQPKWVTELLQGVAQHGANTEHATGRNDAAARLAGYFHAKRIPGDIVLAQLRTWNAFNQPPLPDDELTTVAASAERYEPGQEKAKPEKPKRSQSELMVELAQGQGVTLFLDSGDEPHAVFPVGDHQEIAALDSRRFGWWLRGLLFREYEKSGYQEAVKGAVGVLSAMAAFDEPQHHQLWNRVAWGPDGALWYDLTDERWRAVRITSEGWEVVDHPPVLFQRFAHQKAQVEPQQVSGDDAPEVLAGIWDLVNLQGENQRLLYLGYIGTAYIPDIPHPIPITGGTQGTGKTMGTRMTRELIDPSFAGLLSFSRDGTELVQALSHHWCSYFDNTSTLPDWLQDMLCRAATGEGFSKRRLWTDDEDVIYTFRRCVAINGINVSASRGDLFDRSILFQMDRLDGQRRRSEQELWPLFEHKRARFLGAILTTLSGALRVDAETANGIGRYFRMADFASWGYRFCEALGGRGAEFINAYAEGIGNRSLVALEAHPLGIAVQVLMEGRESWQGTPVELLEVLETVAIAEKVDTTNRAWPGSASWLGRRLREVEVDLREVGIVAEQAHDGTKRTITLTAC